MDYPQRDFTHDEVVRMLDGARAFITPHVDYQVGGCDCLRCERHRNAYLIAEGFKPRPRLVPTQQPWIARPSRASAV